MGGGVIPELDLPTLRALWGVWTVLGALGLLWTGALAVRAGWLCRRERDPYLREVLCRERRDATYRFIAKWWITAFAGARWVLLTVNTPAALDEWQTISTLLYGGIVVLPTIWSVHQLVDARRRL
jgi:hypothetical protein